jgi:hypothetical protein
MSCKPRIGPRKGKYIMKRRKGKRGGTVRKYI